MSKPWELPWAELPHQALPLGEGRWRAPATETNSCRNQLAEFGILAVEELADGSASYLIHDLQEYLPELGEGHPRDPAYRALWIATRLHCGRLAMAERPQAPQFLGILNLTPDSFSDGGKFENGTMGALYHAQCLIAEDADILDLGAESTRPGAREVSPEEQLRRLLPVLEAVLPLEKPVSIDTRSAQVAARCLEAGAHMINDVSGLADPDMASLLADQECPAVLMHMRGTPTDMQEHCSYRHLLGEVADGLMAIAQKALAAGMNPQQVILDPGIGFAKTAAQSRALIADFGSFRALGFPLLAGPSRKSFLAEILPQRSPAQRDGGSLGAAALCAAQGASYLRLHRGGKAPDAMKVAAACALPARQEEPVL
ncbi:MAG: dihydropteroate synthase [Planctomycetota bacterium]|jgi:dihydropteroate synthase